MIDNSKNGKPVVLAAIKKLMPDAVALVTERSDGRASAAMQNGAEVRPVAGADGMARVWATASAAGHALRKISRAIVTFYDAGAPADAVAELKRRKAQLVKELATANAIMAAITARVDAQTAIDGQTGQDKAAPLRVQAASVQEWRDTLAALLAALGVDTGGKVAFDLRGGEVVVTRADADHEDPAIGAFLGLLEADIRAGRHVQSLPDDLARAMLANAHHAVNLDEDIEGEVAL